MTSKCAPINKVKTKGFQKSQANRLVRYTKQNPSYFEHVDVIHSINGSSSTWSQPRRGGK